MLLDVVVGIIFCLRVVVRARLGVGLFGPAGATLRKGGGWGWARSHFGKAVKGVTATGVGRAPGREVGRAPGREVGFPKLLLSKLPGSHMDAT